MAHTELQLLLRAAAGKHTVLSLAGGLPADETFYFVVRARDRAGNRDSNPVERQGVNMCV